MFIYTENQKTKDALLKAGFKLVTVNEQESREKTVWVFVNDKTIPISDFADEGSYILSKKMSF